MTSAPNKGIWIPIGASTKELNAALADAGIQLTQFKKNTEGAAGGSNNFFESLKDVKKEAVSHNRVFNFYGAQLAELAGISKNTGAAMVGMMAGIGSGMWLMAAVEGIKLVVEHFKKVGEAAKEAAEKAKKEWEQFVSKTEQGIQSLKDKLLSLQGIDPETRHMAERYLKLNQDIAKLRAEDPGGIRHEELENLKAQREEVKKLIAERREGLKSVGEAEADIQAQKDREAAQKKAAAAALAYQKDLTAERLAIEKESLTEEQQVWFDFYTQVAKYPELRVQEEQRASDKIAKIREQEELKQFEARLKNYHLANKHDPANEMDPENMLGSTDANVRITSFDVAMKGAKDLTKEMQALGAAGVAAGGALGAIGDAVGGNAGKVLKILGQMTAAAIGLAIAMSATAGPWAWITVGLTAATLIAGIAMAMASTPTPKRSGGQVRGNNPYLVGEFGPELFTPDANGNITPNSGLGGGGVTNIYNVSTLDSKSFEKFLYDNRESVLKANNTLSREGRT